jgi:hypothetical protein
MANRKRRGQGTNERHGRRSDILDRDDQRRPTEHAKPPPAGRRLRLGNQGWLGDGKTASATVTTTATRQLFGVALPSKPRLGALLSSDEWRVERRASDEVSSVMRLGLGTAGGGLGGVELHVVTGGARGWRFRTGIVPRRVNDGRKLDLDLAHIS